MCFSFFSKVDSSQRISQFAKKRGLVKEQPPGQSEKEPKLIIGNVVENLVPTDLRMTQRTVESNEAFPIATRIDRTVSLGEKLALFD